MKKRYAFIAPLFVFLLIGCTLPNSSLPIAAPYYSPAQDLAVRVTQDPNAPPTATPFLPFPVTPLPATPTPESEIPLEDLGLPSQPEGAFSETIQQPAGQINILLMGSDQRPDSGGFRTDVMLLLSVNPRLGTASMISFPRDLYVYIPGWTYNRINTVQQSGGFELIKQTFNYNFGIQPDYYVMINFWSFVDVVDSLGGINVNVAQALTDTGGSVPAGVVHMDGATALWYVRSRYTTSDFDRTRRQQEVLLAMFTRMLSLNGIQRAPELYELYQDNVATNVTFSETLPLVGLAAELGKDPSLIESYAIGKAHVTPYTTAAGAQVLLPDYSAIAKLLKQAIEE